MITAEGAEDAEEQMPSDFPQLFVVTPDEGGRRLDQFLVAHVSGVSRARAQQLIEQRKVLVNGATAKPSLKLRGGENITVLGPVEPPALRAMAEEIPLDVVYEDDDLAVINKPAGMMVHAGAGATEDARNRGTLVNALLHRFAALSGVGGTLRPGIVHRLDRNTSGLIVVAKNDAAHQRLSQQFSGREVHKTYLALVHGCMRTDSGTVTSAIARDGVRRTRMTTRRPGGRSAVSHWCVLERIDGPYGRFSLLQVTIETGRTHQIRVHLSSLGHPVVGDTLCGAPREIKPLAQQNPAHRGKREESGERQTAALARNFLHAAIIEFKHPRTAVLLRFQRPLPPELEEFAARLRGRP